MQSGTIISKSTFHKIGEKYIQLSNPDGTWNSDEAPENKFGGLWSLILANEGTFFKTEGHEPAQIYDNNVLEAYRINGLSKAINQRITGSVTNNIHMGAVGAGALNQNHYHTAGDNRTSGFRWGTITFDNATSPSARTTTDTAGRTEPQNRLMRIWQKME